MPQGEDVELVEGIARTGIHCGKDRWTASSYIVASITRSQTAIRHLAEDCSLRRKGAKVSNHMPGDSHGQQEHAPGATKFHANLGHPNSYKASVYAATLGILQYRASGTPPAEYVAFG